VLRTIIGLKRDEIIRGWRKLHNEELHKFYAYLVYELISTMFQTSYTNTVVRKRLNMFMPRDSPQAVPMCIITPNIM
jgi:hypothetical protein